MLKDEANFSLGAFCRQLNDTITEIDDLKTTLLSTQNGHRTTEVIIGGDFNLPGIVCSDRIKDPPSYGSHTFVEIRESLDLTQMVQKPTREGNILDLIIVTSPDRCHRLDVIPGISDHDAVCAKYQAKVSRHNSEETKKHISFQPRRYEFGKEKHHHVSFIKNSLSWISKQIAQSFPTTDLFRYYLIFLNKTRNKLRLD